MNNTGDNKAEFDWSQLEDAFAEPERVVVRDGVWNPSSKNSHVLGLYGVPRDGKGPEYYRVNKGMDRIVEVVDFPEPFSVSGGFTLRLSTTCKCGHDGRVEDENGVVILTYIPDR